MRILDTNILLRYFTGDDQKKAQKVFDLLKRVESGEESLLVSSAVIFETIEWRTVANLGRFLFNPPLLSLI